MANVGKWDEAFDQLNARLDKLGEKAKESIDANKKARHNTKAEIDEIIGEAKGDLVAAQEQARAAGERGKSKVSSELLKAQMSFGALQEKLQEKKDAIDKKGLELYIDGRLGDAADFFEGALFLMENARLSMLEAASAAAEYEEKYGD